MGWLESPPYFGVASETARDVGQVYAQAPIDMVPQHRFEKYTIVHEDFKCLPATSNHDDELNFGLEIFVDHFIGAVVQSSQE